MEAKPYCCYHKHEWTSPNNLSPTPLRCVERLQLSLYMSLRMILWIKFYEFVNVMNVKSVNFIVMKSLNLLGMLNLRISLWVVVIITFEQYKEFLVFMNVLNLHVVIVWSDIIGLNRTILGGAWRAWTRYVRLMAQGQIPSQWRGWKLQ